MDTVRVKFLRGTSLGNGCDAFPGDVVDLDRRLYAQFAQQGRVVQVAVADIAPAAEIAPPDASDKPIRKGRRNA